MSILCISQDHAGDHSLRGEDLAEFTIIEQLGSNYEHSDLNQFKVVYFSPYSGFDQNELGNSLYDFVRNGGVLVYTGFAHHQCHKALKGSIEPFLPLQRAQQDMTSRTVGTIFPTDFESILDNLRGGEIRCYHMQNTDMVREDTNFIRVADSTTGIPIAAVSKLEKGLIIQLNAVATSSSKYGCVNSKILVQNALRFAVNFQCHSNTRSSRHSLVCTSNVSHVKIRIADDMFLFSDTETAKTFSEVLANMIEGDPQAQEYFIKIPCVKCAEMLAFFLRTGELPQEKIDPCAFVSLLQASEYIQSDRLIHIVISYFRNVRNAQFICMQDSDFNSSNIPPETLKKLLPQSLESILESNSPWKEVFLKWWNQT